MPTLPSASLDDFKTVTCCSSAFIEEFNATVIALTRDEPVVRNEGFMYVYDDPEETRRQSLTIRDKKGRFFARVKVNEHGRVDARIRGENHRVSKLEIEVTVSGDKKQKCSVPESSKTLIKQVLKRAIV